MNRLTDPLPVTMNTYPMRISICWTMNTFCF